MKRAYYYLFYKLYRFFENSPSRWMSDLKAGLVIMILEMWFMISSLTYYAILKNTGFDILINKTTYFIIFLLAMPINVYLFVFKDDWRNYLDAFDKLPKKKNFIGSWIVILFVLLIIVNFILSVYFYYNI